MITLGFRLFGQDCGEIPIVPFAVRLAPGLVTFVVKSMNICNFIDIIVVGGVGKENQKYALLVGAS
jgi:hypothetical protein